MARLTASRATLVGAMPQGAGCLPGLKGKLNPIRDTHERAYLRASNIAINKGRPQPAAFLFGEEIQLTDADGCELWARIIDIIGSAVLLEYSAAARGGSGR